MISNCACLDEAKAKRCEWLKCNSVFIKTCREPDWIPKRQPESLIGFEWSSELSRDKIVDELRSEK